VVALRRIGQVWARFSDKDGRYAGIQTLCAGSRAAVAEASVDCEIQLDAMPIQPRATSPDSRGGDDFLRARRQRALGRRRPAEYVGSAGSL